MADLKLNPDGTVDREFPDPDKILRFTKPRRKSSDGDSGEAGPPPPSPLSPEIKAASDALDKINLESLTKPELDILSNSILEKRRMVGSQQDMVQLRMMIDTINNIREKNRDGAMELLRTKLLGLEDQ